MHNCWRSTVLKGKLEVSKIGFFELTLQKVDMFLGVWTYFVYCNNPSLALVHYLCIKFCPWSQSFFFRDWIGLEFCIGLLRCFCCCSKQPQLIDLVASLLKIKSAKPCQKFHEISSQQRPTLKFFSNLKTDLR
jgi:hypothetical protein